MDVPVVVENTVPAREVLRDARGTIIGRVEHQRLTGKLVLRDHRGVVLGSYDPRSNETRDAHGRVMGRGNLLGVLLIHSDCFGSVASASDLIECRHQAIRPCLQSMDFARVRKDIPIVGWFRIGASPSSAA